MRVAQALTKLHSYPNEIVSECVKRGRPCMKKVHRKALDAAAPQRQVRLRATPKRSSNTTVRYVHGSSGDGVAREKNDGFTLVSAQPVLGRVTYGRRYGEMKKH